MNGCTIFDSNNYLGHYFRLSLFEKVTKKFLFNRKGTKIGFSFYDNHINTTVFLSDNFLVHWFYGVIFMGRFMIKNCLVKQNIALLWTL